MRRTSIWIAGNLFIGLGFAGCGGVPAEAEGVFGEWVGEEEVRGDTTIVRTTGGSVWQDTMALAPQLVVGELAGDDPYVFGQVAAVARDREGQIYVADAQAGEVRLFDAEGDFVRTVGRAGQGPGEYLRPDGVRIASNGEVVIRDQRGGRFLVFAPDGEYRRMWRLSGVFSTPAPFHVDHTDRILNPDVRMALDPSDPDRSVLVAYDLHSGQVLDTLAVPGADAPPALVELISGNGQGRTWTGVPFHPVPVWEIGGPGRLFGYGTEYVLSVEAPDGGVLRIERSVEGVPVQPAEAAAARDLIEEQFRARDPSWRWNGPPIPGSKPPYRWAGFGVDGSIWVLRHTRASETDNPFWEPDAPERGPRTMWIERPVMDVFDGEGRFLGPVQFPEGWQPWRPGVLSVDGPVLVVPHELGYDRVIRYDLVSGRAEEVGEGGPDG